MRSRSRAAYQEFVQFGEEFESRREQPFAKRCSERAVGCFHSLVEEFQVLAVVEEIEELLVPSRSEQVQTEARASSDHLPELGFGAHDFEKHEIDDFRHIDTGIEHV